MKMRVRRRGGCGLMQNMILARKQRAFALLLAALLAWQLPAGGAQTPVEAQRQELQRLRQRIEQARKSGERLREEQQALRQEARRISRDLVRLAAEAQALEQRIAAAGRRIARLEKQRGELLARLSANRAVTTRLLAALQRLRRDPPPPFVTRPEDVLGAVRGALAMGAVLPRMDAQAKELRANLQKLQRLEQQLRREHEERRQSLAALRNTRSRLRGMLTLKQELLARTGQRLAEEKARLARLLKQAGTLEELLNALERARRAAKARKAEKPGKEQKEETTRQPSAARQPREEKEKAGAQAGRTRALAARVPFKRLRGRLPWPAQGRKVAGFGERSRLLGELKGLYVATLPGAVITAPADAKVLLAGRFRGYGKLVILNVGQGYRILLAGLKDVSVQAGDVVRAGEPLGSMGSRPAPSTVVDENVAAARPILYMELRKGKKLLDPSGWFMSGRRQARKS